MGKLTYESAREHHISQRGSSREGILLVDVSVTDRIHLGMTWDDNSGTCLRLLSRCAFLNRYADLGLNGIVSRTHGKAVSIGFKGVRWNARMETLFDDPYTPEFVLRTKRMIYILHLL